MTYQVMAKREQTNTSRPDPINKISFSLYRIFNASSISCPERNVLNMEIIFLDGQNTELFRYADRKILVAWSNVNFRAAVSWSGPYGNLPGNGNLPMFTTNFDIKENSKGEFLSIEYQGESYSLDDWTKKVTSTPVGQLAHNF